MSRDWCLSIPGYEADPAVQAWLRKVEDIIEPMVERAMLDLRADDMVFLKFFPRGDTDGKGS